MYCFKEPGGLGMLEPGGLRARWELSGHRHPCRRGRQAVAIGSSLAVFVPR